MIQSLFNQVLGLGPAEDEQLMGRVRTHGDPEAFAVLVSRWQQPIHGLCVRMIGDGHRAEDLTQEAFTRLFTYRARYLPSARFSTYLWQIALNLCRDELRRRGRNREDCMPAEEVEDLLQDPALSALSAVAPDAYLSQREKTGEVQCALAELPPLYREVLVLRHYEGLKFREIAEVLDVPEGTVKSRMIEALNRMAALLQGDPENPERRGGEKEHSIL